MSCGKFDVESFICSKSNSQYAVETIDLLKSNTCCTYNITLMDMQCMAETVIWANIVQYSGVMCRRKRGLAAGIRLMSMLANEGTVRHASKPAEYYEQITSE